MCEHDVQLAPQDNQAESIKTGKLFMKLQYIEQTFLWSFVDISNVWRVLVGKAALFVRDLHGSLFFIN